MEVRPEVEGAARLEEVEGEEVPVVEWVWIPRRLAMAGWAMAHSVASLLERSQSTAGGGAEPVGGAETEEGSPPLEGTGEGRGLWRRRGGGSPPSRLPTSVGGTEPEARSRLQRP